MRIVYAIFYQKVRQYFGGKLNQNQVEGMQIIVDEFLKNTQDLRWIAYGLATARWETANTMQPIEEYGKGKGRPYGNIDPITGHAYYGRGYVQLTWNYNYKSMSKLVGANLYTQPELALDKRTAAKILVLGMINGSFTGVSLKTFFNDKKDDPINARKIINGLDKSTEIAKYYEDFLYCLKQSATFGITPTTPAQVVAMEEGDHEATFSDRFKSLVFMTSSAVTVGIAGLVWYLTH